MYAFCFSIYCFLFFFFIMDAPRIVVFTEKIATQPQSDLIKRWVDLEFAPMVDSLHADSYDWFVKNVKPCPHRLFSVDFAEEEILFYEVDELSEQMEFRPDMLIYFNEDRIMDLVHWIYIKHWVQFHLFGGIKTEFVDKAADLMKPPFFDKVGLAPVIQNQKQVQFYGYRHEYLEEDDIMLYEITKPYTDLPYTSLIRNFSTKGHKAFFPTLYICPSWGVSRYDLPFLQSLWSQEFGFPAEEFDMDNMLQMATDACYPKEGMIPEPEPEVYRRVIEDVKHTLKKRKSGMECHNAIRAKNAKCDTIVDETR